VSVTVFLTKLTKVNKACMFAMCVRTIVAGHVWLNTAVGYVFF